MKKTLISILVIAALIFLATLFFKNTPPPTDLKTETETTNTETGTEMSEGSETEGTETKEESGGILEASLNTSVNLLGVEIKPIQILEDSRCPVGAECIQAGTVRIKASITSGAGQEEKELEIGKAIIVSGIEVTLTEVLPEATLDTKIEDSEYKFNFQVLKI